MRFPLSWRHGSWGGLHWARHGKTHFGLPLNGIWERDLNGSLGWVSWAQEEAGWVKVVGGAGAASWG